MVRAALSPVMSRESLVPADRQLVLASVQNDMQQEEIKRTYSIQNKLLARKNEELQLRVTTLENQLFQTQKEVLSLKNEKIKLTETLKLNSKRFNDIIVTSLDNLMSNYRTFMSDLGIDVEKKKLPLHLSQKVSEENNTDSKATDFDHYWQNINDDLQRRKSLLLRFKPDTTIPTMDALENSIGSNPTEEQLDTLVEEAENEKDLTPLEPEYEDEEASSTNIPIKRQSIVMEKMDNYQLSDIPFLGLSKVEEVNDNKNCNSNSPDKIDNNNDDLFNHIGEEPLPPVKTNNHIEVETNINESEREPASPVKSNNHIVIENNINESEREPIFSEDESERDQPIKKQPVKRRRVSRVPRELRNLDTEKTKKWLGMDPLDDVEESTSERRKSRRRSLVVNYQLPSLKQKMRRSNKVYIDDDKENKVKKPKINSNRHILRNITNTVDNNNEHNRNQKSSTGKSIFDLENDDIFGDYDRGLKNTKKSKKISRNEVYDMLL